MRLSLLLPVLLTASGGASVACVLYTVQGNYRPSINKIFTAMGVSFFLWTLGLAIQAAGSLPMIRFAGSVLAPVGYVTMFGFLLHYILYLTGHSSFAKKPWVSLLIYAPGAVLIYGLTVQPLLGSVKGGILPTALGCANMISNAWYHAFYCYYIVCLLFIVLILKNWSSKTEPAKVQKQAGLLLNSLWVCIALSTAVELVLPLREIEKPSIAPLFFMLPILAISHCVRRSGFMQPDAANPNETILDRANRTMVYRILGFFFLIGSMMNLFNQHFFYRETAQPSTFLLSGLLVLIGGVTLLLSRLALDELFKELVFAVLFSLLIPFVTLRFIVYGSITIWSFFFPLLMVSLLFNKRILLITVLLSAGQTQLLVYCVTPFAVVTLDSADYMIRLGLIALTGMMSFYISKVYRSRLKENAGYAYRQTLIAEIAYSMVSVDEHSFDEKMESVLLRCGSFLQCEWAYLALWNMETGVIHYCREWRADEVTSIHSICKSGSPFLCKELSERIPESRVLAVPDVEQLVLKDKIIKEQLEQMGIRGFVLTPLVRHGEEFGLMSFATSSADKNWAEEPPLFLSIVADTVTDAAAKVDDRKKIKWAAYHDPLTGLPNRLSFKHQLNLEIERAKRSNAKIGVAFIDLDAFKSINDTTGHDMGDLILQRVSKAIAGSIGPGDVVARIGGDEFVLMLSQASDEDKLIQTVRGILEAIQRPIILHGQNFYMTGSIGVSRYPCDGTDAETLMKHADIAMYEAKGMGKNQFALCLQAYKEKAMENARLSNLLYRAMEKKQLSVHYQPQIDLKTGEIMGIEALLRWELPDRGFVSPAVFIPLAEQTGLIQPIGAWVLETACAQCKSWQNMGLPPVRISVNISVQQLENRGFVQQVADVLHKTELPPEYLELEVTESVANGRVGDMVVLMNRLKRLGVSISIGDFGTEYSLLERLKLLPIDRIKMDIQFVWGIEHSDKDRAIAQVIIHLAKSLEMKVIAEGVETEEQLRFLSQKMCDEVQGYYYFRPMPPGELEEIFRRCPDFGRNGMRQES
ncbi:EAL domain-containing protein [Faecalispora anaeroviscerum]|uniref:EAL domain-containing protein n=1 Tax=Faecalispora anaeroviscerum TaxID=2991836 RepID=UPI0024B953A0|nr:EAL domain-containing protein [Faecalispora anaeroviscerum]